MTTLMTYAGPGDPEALATRTGGMPLAPIGTSWPACATCERPMQFLAQIVLNDLNHLADQTDAHDGHVMVIFMCQNDPGMCDDWSPTAGGNRALLLPATELRPMAGPDEGEGILHLDAVNAVNLVSLAASDYGSAREEWGSRSGNDLWSVLGQLGGQADWLQDDETPECPSCARPMDLVAQFEEGPVHATAMNFGGGGAAFAFACEPCVQASFLWQC